MAMANKLRSESRHVKVFQGASCLGELAQLDDTLGRLQEDVEAEAYCRSPRRAGGVMWLAID